MYFTGHYAQQQRLRAKVNIMFNTINTFLQAVGSTYGSHLKLNNIEQEIAKAAINDLQSDTETKVAFKLLGGIKSSWRKSVKAMAVASVRSAIKGQGATFLNNLEDMTFVHGRLANALLKIKADIIRWDKLDADLPWWQIYTYVGDDNGKPIFEIDELWTRAEFLEFVKTSTKWRTDCAKWVIEDSIASATLPIVRATSPFTSATLERFKDDDFYTSGNADIEFVEFALARIGRLVKAFNIVVWAVNQQAGRFMLRHQRAGGESLDTQVEILGGIYTLSISSEVNEGQYLVDDSEMRRMLADIDKCQADLQRYLASWEEILPSMILKAVGLEYHGGFDPITKEGVTEFKQRKLEWPVFEPELSDAVHQQSRDAMRQNELKRLQALIDNSLSTERVKKAVETDYKMTDNRDARIAGRRK